MRKNAVQNMVLVGAFTAILAVLSQLSIPLPSGVPVTLQTFAVALCGFALGAKTGTLAVAVYLLLGAIGIPVFAGFMGGVGVFVGVTGGFLWGFLLLAVLCGTQKIPLAALGLIACHALGIIQFAIVAKTPLLQSAVLVSVPYLLKDALSLVAAYLAARAVRRGLTAARFAPR